MKSSRETYLDKLFKAAYHYKNCELEYETDPDTGTRAFCTKHGVEVTEVLPDYGYIPDDYQNQHENNLL